MRRAYWEGGEIAYHTADCLKETDTIVLLDESGDKIPMRIQDAFGSCHHSGGTSRPARAHVNFGEKSRFCKLTGASLLAHEINNPLAALTNLMFLLNQQPLASSARDFLSQASDALTRINRIASMTLGFYFEKDTPAPLHVTRIIDEVAEMLRSTESFNGIHVVREFRCDATVVASQSRMRQLIVNLLTNAMESGARTVHIRVRMGPDWRRRGRGGVRITVADDGRGIRPELREKIFEPFFSTKAENGTGLGLWASRAVVSRNDGTIRLRSAVSSPRRGTCVCVFLPTAANVLNIDSNDAAEQEGSGPSTCNAGPLLPG